MVPSKQVFSVPNTEEGWEFIKSLRKYLNDDMYVIDMKGRGSDRVARGGNGQWLRPKDSEWIAVYIRLTTEYYKLSRIMEERSRVREENSNKNGR